MWISGEWWKVNVVNYAHASEQNFRLHHIYYPNLLILVRPYLSFVNQERVDKHTSNSESPICNFQSSLFLTTLLFKIPETSVRHDTIRSSILLTIRRLEGLKIWMLEIT